MNMTTFSGGHPTSFAHERPQLSSLCSFHGKHVLYVERLLYMIYKIIILYLKISKTVTYGPVSDTYPKLKCRHGVACRIKFRESEDVTSTNR